MLLAASNGTAPTIEPMDEKRSGRPATSRERSELLRRLVRDLLRVDFDGNQTAAARALKITGATLSNFLSGKAQAGSKIEDGITSYLRRSVDQIVAHGGDLEALRGGSSAPMPLREVRFGDLANWPDLYRAAREVAPSVPRWAWVYTAKARVLLDVAIGPAFVAGIAQTIHHHLAPPAPASEADTDVSDDTPPSSDH